MATYKQLNMATHQTSSQHTIANRWYRFLDEVRRELEQNQCNQHDVQMLRLYLYASPFRPLRPIRSELASKIQSIIFHISSPFCDRIDPNLRRASQNLVESHRYRNPINVTAERLQWIWGPWCTNFTPVLHIDEVRKLDDFYNQWKQITGTIIKQVNTCYQNGRSVILYFLNLDWFHWNRSEKKETRLGHLTLLYVDPVRLTYGLFDPSMAYMVLQKEENSNMTYHFMDLVAELPFPGYRVEHPKFMLPKEGQVCAVQCTLEPKQCSPKKFKDGGYCTTVCFLMYYLMHRLGYFDVMHMAHATYEAIWPMHSRSDIRPVVKCRLALNKWQLQLSRSAGGGTDSLCELLCLKKQLGGNHHQTCDVVRADGTFCTQPPKHPHLVYCADHIHMLGASPDSKNDNLEVFFQNRPLPAGFPKNLPSHMPHDQTMYESVPSDDSE